MSKTQEQLAKIIAEIEGKESNKAITLQDTGKKLSTNEVIDILLSDSLSLTDSNTIKNGTDEAPSQFWYDMQELRRWKDQNNNNYSIPYYRQIDTHTRHFPKILSFAKRVVRKLCRSLVEPICIDVSNFNSSVTASINALYNNEVVTEAFTNYQLSLNQENDKRFIALENNNQEKYLNYQKKLEEIHSSIQKELSHPNIAQILADQKFINQLKGAIAKELNSVQEEIEQQIFTHVVDSLDKLEQRIDSTENMNIEINDRLDSCESQMVTISQKISDSSAQIEEIKSSYLNSNQNISDTISQFKGALSEIENKFSTALAETKAEFEDALLETKNSYNTILAEYENKMDTSLTETELCLLRMLKEKSIPGFEEKDHHNTASEKNENKVLSKSIYTSLDYFKFENYFRGSRTQVMKNQKEYLKFLRGKGHVLDLGCGRGELLELLRDNGITATGIDSYEEFVEYCQLKGLHAEVGKVPSCLNSIPNESIGAVFAGQLIEHITFDELNKLCQEIYRIMISGGCLIIETPNPTCLATYLNSFYMDPSHNKPVHPKTLQYLLQQQGFNNIQVIYTEQSKAGYRLPLLSVPNADNLSEFNDGINALSDIIFGSQDYAIIAYK